MWFFLYVKWKILKRRGLSWDHLWVVTQDSSILHLALAFNIIWWAHWGEEVSSGTIFKTTQISCILHMPLAVNTFWWSHWGEEVPPSQLGSSLDGDRGFQYSAFCFWHSTHIDEANEEMRSQLGPSLKPTQDSCILHFVIHSQQHILVKPAEEKRSHLGPSLDGDRGSAFCLWCEVNVKWKVLRWRDLSWDHLWR